MHKKESGGREADVAKRLRLLRAAEGGHKSKVFALRMGFSGPQYSNYENGVPLSKPAAIQLATRIPGLTIDWLYMGREEGLPVALRQRLHQAKEALEAEENSPKAPSSSPRKAAR
jgi:transcriptional regulator with XRE-family HTH domain